MNEDYLWDKTGEDPEIEKLENALQAFRYRETAPPALPANAVPSEKETPRRFFQFAFAFAACAACVVILLGVWFQFSSNKIEVVEDLTETISPPTVSDEIFVKEPDITTVEIINFPKPTAKQNVVKIRKSVPLIARQNKTTTARNIEVKKPSVKLTEEEKYAYEQLMLALSITGSKLKLVKDKVEGIGEQHAVLEKRP
jgi:hypothetical protein